MMTAVVTTRYAEAFLQYARETLGFTEGVRELLEFRQVLAENPEFKNFLESPDFGVKEKFLIIDKVIAGNFPKEIGVFLKLLIQKERIRSLSNIMEYIRMNYGYGDMVSAVLASAFPLDDDLVQSIKSRLEEKTGRRINLYVMFDADLLGGFKVTIGNKVFDGSLRRQLAELKERSINWRSE